MHTKNSWFCLTLAVSLFPLVASGHRACCGEESPAEQTGDALTPLAAAVRVVNEQAVKHGVKQEPLTESQVLDALDKLEQAEGLSDEHFQLLKNISATRILPAHVSLRQFLRYDNHAAMQHGWWVKLILERDSGGAYGIWIRKHLDFTRPFTQKERQFRDEVRRTGGFPTLGRLVTYFEDEPRFNQTAALSADYEELVNAARAAIEQHNLADFLKLFHWDGADDALREFIKREATEIVNQKFQLVTVEKKRFQGELAQWQGFTRYGPNLPVEGYIDFVYAKRQEQEPNSLRLEMGEHQGKPWFVCHVTKEDRTDQFIGKRLSKPISISGFISPLPDGWLEFGWNIDAPDELPALGQANLELWRLPG